MGHEEIPYDADLNKSDFLISDLIDRISLSKRASWLDIYQYSGVYVIYLPKDLTMSFNNEAGCSNASCTTAEYLFKKWQILNSNVPSDIVYIGKGNVRKRIRALIRFGLGKASSHRGGEWLWQINQVKSLRLLISSCPYGKEIAYEKWLLDKFRNQHGDWPLANRKGGSGNEYWHPGMQ